MTSHPHLPGTEPASVLTVLQLRKPLGPGQTGMAGPLTVKSQSRGPVSIQLPSAIMFSN